MGLVAAKCTQCGASIKVDETKEAGICPHCGTAFITEKVINNYIVNNNTTINQKTVNIYQGGASDKVAKNVEKINRYYKLEDGSGVSDTIDLLLSIDDTDFRVWYEVLRYVTLDFLSGNGDFLDNGTFSLNVYSVNLVRWSYFDKNDVSKGRYTIKQIYEKCLTLANEQQLSVLEPMYASYLNNLDILRKEALLKDFDKKAHKFCLDLRIKNEKTIDTLEAIRKERNINEKDYYTLGNIIRELIYNDAIKSLWEINNDNFKLLNLYNFNQQGDFVAFYITAGSIKMIVGNSYIREVFVDYIGFYFSSYDQENFEEMIKVETINKNGVEFATRLYLDLETVPNRSINLYCGDGIETGSVEFKNLVRLGKNIFYEIRNLGYCDTYQKNNFQLDFLNKTVGYSVEYFDTKYSDLTENQKNNSLLDFVKYFKSINGLKERLDTKGIENSFISAEKLNKLQLDIKTEKKEITTSSSTGKIKEEKPKKISKPNAFFDKLDDFKFNFKLNHPTLSVLIAIVYWLSFIIVSISLVCTPFLILNGATALTEATVNELIFMGIAESIFIVILVLKILIKKNRNK